MLPNLEHEEFFELLLISPSYQLATEIKKGQINMPSANSLPIDFDKVLDIYELVGDLSEIPFDTWWQTTGKHIFADVHHSNEVQITIDITKSEAEILGAISQLIESKRHKLSSAKKITFLKNKIQYKTLSSRVNLVHDLATKRTRFPAMEYWRIAVFSGLNSQYIKGLKIDSKKTQGNIVAREKLTELVTKHLREALYLSENAARGIFPSNDPINTGLEFDLSYIDSSGSKQVKKAYIYWEEQKAKGKKRLNDSQRATLRKRASKKVI